MGQNKREIKRKIGPRLDFLQNRFGGNCILGSASNDILAQIRGCYNQHNRATGVWAAIEDVFSAFSCLQDLHVLHPLKKGVKALSTGLMWRSHILFGSTPASSPSLFALFAYLPYERPRGAFVSFERSQGCHSFKINTTRGAFFVFKSKIFFLKRLVTPRVLILKKNILLLKKLPQGCFY